MIYFLEFLSEALGEAEEATKYYEEIQPGLGVRFCEKWRLSLKPSWFNHCFGGNALVDFDE